MSTFLVDYENVYIDGLEGLENLTEEDTVCIFYTLNRCGMTFDLHKRLMKSKAEIKLLEVPSAPPKNPYSKASVAGSIKNALDLQLTLYLGFLMAKYSSADEQASIFIISRDKDFGLDLEFTKEYLSGADIEVGLFNNIQKALDRKKIDEESEAEISAESNEPFNDDEDSDSTESNYENTNKFNNFDDNDFDETSLVNQNSNTSIAVREEFSSALFAAVDSILTNGLSEEQDEEFVKEICKMIVSSDDLLALNNSLAGYLRDGEKVKEIYHIIKPQFDLLKTF